MSSQFEQTKSFDIISRYCPTCKAQIKCWRMERGENGKFIERCIDCGQIGLTELRETVGELQS
jgi:Zn ribbon nucleic-acid-binding protein